MISSKLLNITNSITEKLLMPFMAICFLLFNTIVNQMLGNRIETIENIIILILILVFLLNFFKIGNGQKLNWIKAQWPVWVYFAFRLLSVACNGFEYSAIRSILIESFYLVCINNVIIKKESIKRYINLLILFDIVLVTTSIVLYWTWPNLPQNVISWFETNAYYLAGTRPVAVLFGNPNSAGIMAGMAASIGLIYLVKEKNRRIFAIVLLAINLYEMILSQCRNAVVGFILFAICYIGYLFIKKINIQIIACTMIVASITALIPIYGLSLYNESQEKFTYTAMEQKLDVASSGRYILWKECIIAEKERPLLGYGSLSAELKARLKLEENIGRYKNGALYSGNASFGPHNSFIGLVSACGILGFVAFIIILFDRIRNSRRLEDEHAPVIVYLLSVCNLESLLILNRFFTCFYLFLLLPMMLNEEEDI